MTTTQPRWTGPELADVFKRLEARMACDLAATLKGFKKSPSASAWSAHIAAMLAYQQVQYLPSTEAQADALSKLPADRWADYVVLQTTGKPMAHHVMRCI